MRRGGAGSGRRKRGRKRGWLKLKIVFRLTTGLFLHALGFCGAAWKVSVLLFGKFIAVGIDLRGFLCFFLELRDHGILTVMLACVMPR